MTLDQKQKLQEVNCQFSGLYSLSKSIGNNRLIDCVVTLGETLMEYTDMMKEEKNAT